MATRFSVVLGSYNGERFLAAQIESLERQTRRPDEVVVVDDGSTDRSVELLHTFARRLPLRISVNEANLGSTANFERGLELASGDCIALCDQDDVWDPQKLARLEVALGAGAGMVFTDAELIDEDGAPVGRRLWDAIGFRGSTVRRFAAEPLRLLARGKNVVTGATMAFRAELKELVLPIPRDWAHDGWIAIVAALASSLRALPEPLIQYRIHPGQQLGVEAPVSSARRNPEALRRQLRQYEAVVERTRPIADPRRLRWVEGLVAHLKARAELDAARPARLQAIVRELAGGGYHRYSNGLRSALKDLLAP